jgi:hypothetical protein
MRGGGETGCDVRGKQTAVCVHVNTQGGGFRGDEAYLLFYYSWNGGRAEAVCAGENE